MKYVWSAVTALVVGAAGVISTVWSWRIADFRGAKREHDQHTAKEQFVSLLSYMNGRNDHVAAERLAKEHDLDTTEYQQILIQMLLRRFDTDGGFYDPDSGTFIVWDGIDRLTYYGMDLVG